MSNQLMNKAASLAAILAQNKLVKQADESIEHKTPLSQDGIGAEQTQELRDGQYHVTADTQAAANTPKEKVQEEPAGITPLNKEPEAALSATGTDVQKVTTDGDKSTEPANLTYSKAASYRDQLAGILAMSKKASAPAEPPKIMTGTEVMEKLAALTEQSPKEAFDEASDAIVKLASTNPLFGICKERIMMEKQAADIMELAQSQNISIKQAAEELDAAMEANPEMAQDLDNEATEAAIGDLANVEQQAAELGPQIDQMAANASEALGTEVTPDDILSAADEVAAKAEEMGVPPEALIQAALEEMQGGAGAQPSEEDVANAQQILDAAAAQGISPEEVIQMATEEMGGGEAPAEAPAEDKTASAKPAEKPAEQPQFQSKRAAYCAYIRNNK